MLFIARRRKRRSKEQLPVYEHDDPDLPEYAPNKESEAPAKRLPVDGGESSEKERSPNCIQAVGLADRQVKDSSPFYLFASSCQYPPISSNVFSNPNKISLMSRASTSFISVHCATLTPGPLFGR